MSRIGIFAGTFDPIHNGHIAFATAASQALALDKVVFVAEPHPHRKTQVTALRHREAMLGIAFKQQPHFMMLKEPWRNIDTVQARFEQITKYFKQDTGFYLLMGGDAFAYLEHWGDNIRDRGGYKAILSHVAFIVALREGNAHAEIEAIEQRIRSKVIIIPSPEPMQSSTAIRASLATGQNPEGIAPEVLTYIRTQNLYHVPQAPDLPLT
ncbi:MAG: hypothetical protein C9356_10225 [Oleiphilus sp.]|nr:MAG: hypothetical protein C9356_10225 [Oleiphilus sp.]